jgi:GNAT superfamily N-acetyltransferase
VRIDLARVAEFSSDHLTELVAESERDGWRHVRRLVEEWESGANRFDGPGEALFAARVGGRVVGVCGLNADPYAAEERVGRVRRLYVLTAYRRNGVGRRLLAEVVRAARGVFDRLRLRTNNPDAARFFEALGFRRCADVFDSTHCLELRATHHPPAAGP